jgi:hypothetical protein
MMLLRKHNYLQKGVWAFVLGTLLYSCSNARNTTPGGREMPARSMLPDNHILDLGEGTDQIPLAITSTGFPFATQYLDLPVAGGAQKFVFLSLPDSSSDIKVAALIDNYRLLATTLIDQWAAQKTGILLDLRSSGEHIKKAGFVVRNSRASFPVVLVWDDAATTRAAGYCRIMEIVPGMQPADQSLMSDSTLQLLPATGPYARPQLTGSPVGNCFQ